MQLTIPGELTDLNTYIKALNSNRWSGNAIKQTETERVAYEAMLARLSPVTEYPVTIRYRWYCPNNRKDTDNVAFAKKFVMDGLVLAGVLENDGRKHVAGFLDEFYIDAKNPRIEVDLIPTVRLHDTV